MQITNTEPRQLMTDRIAWAVLAVCLVVLASAPERPAPLALAGAVAERPQQPYGVRCLPGEYPGP